jgi:hypothetical protein
MMAVPISTSPQFAPGTPVKLFDSWVRGALAGYDVSRDGQRFLVLAPGDDFVPTPATLITNWRALLRK